MFSRGIVLRLIERESIIIIVVINGYYAVKDYLRSNLTVRYRAPPDSVRSQEAYSLKLPTININVHPRSNL